MKTLIREKKIFCGEYMEVDIYQHTQYQRPKRRAKRENVSAPKQKNLNDKNAKRYIGQVLKLNFGEGDHHLVFTYNDRYLPDSEEGMEREITNLLRRVSHRRKKLGLPPLKYILVNETTGKDGKIRARPHHHVIMNQGLTLEEIIDLWRKPRRKGQEKGDSIGIVKSSILQPDENGFTGLAKYLTKSKSNNSQKRWSGSQNLERPTYRTNDHKYSRRQVEKIVQNEIDNNLYWKKKYPDWDITDCKPVYNDITGWSIYLKLRRARE